MSWKAQVRLCKRYRRLIARGKNATQVVVALARELAAFVWAVAREVGQWRTEDTLERSGLSGVLNNCSPALRSGRVAAPVWHNPRRR
jgi:hypothetical protein